jgi:hypothetical protein
MTKRRRQIDAVEGEDSSARAGDIESFRQMFAEAGLTGLDVYPG